MEIPSKIPIEEIIQNSLPNHLYSREFEGKRFFTIVFQDENGFEIKLAPRTMMKVVYLKENNDIEGIEIIKQSDKNTQRVNFSKFNFQQLRNFLEFISETELGNISERRTKITIANELDEETKKHIEILLSSEESGETIKKILENGIVTEQDIVNTGYRKQQLDLFEKLIENVYLQEYKKTINKANTKDEIAWQYFFNQNQWIFGYGLDYRFQGILQKEFHASDSNAAGKQEVISDFLLGDNNFTTFVELKLPSAKLFGKEQNRSKSWRLSNDLIDSVSQILEQKASGQIKIEGAKELYDDKGSIIRQHAYDSKTILIIGNWNEVNQSNDSPEIKQIKRKTFELFRRDSRNIDIITYDELLDRSRYIVNKQIDNKDLEKDVIFEDDLPF
jgi:hypothetical protein